MLPYVKRMLDRARAGEISSEDLKIEWYKLATDFGFSVREHYSSFFLMDWMRTLDLADLVEKHLTSPNLVAETWERPKKLCFPKEMTSKKDPEPLAIAGSFSPLRFWITLFEASNRYGLERLHNRKFVFTDWRLAGSWPTVLYFGPRTIEEVEEVFLKAS